jgi:anaerobic selenocysteine-containing dehydrogenase
MNDAISRRQMLFLTLFAGAAGGALAGESQPKVNEKDSVAAALGYVSDARRVDTKASPTYQAGATCSTCSWYQGKADDPAGGPCTFFPGKNVDANGWCRMWNKKQ